MFTRLYWLSMGIGSIIMILASWIGLSIDSKGFLVNIFTEITSLVVTIFFISIIIDQYNKYQRRREWEKICYISYKAIYYNLFEINRKIEYNYPEIKDTIIPVFRKKGEFPRPIDNYKNSERMSGNERLYKRHFEDLIEKFIRYDEKLRVKDRKKQIPFNKYTINYVDSIKENIYQISDIWLPRLISKSDNKELINQLAQFDFASLALISTIEEFKSHPNSISNFSYTNGGRGSISIFDLIFFFTIIMDILILMSKEYDPMSYRIYDVEKDKAKELYVIYRNKIIREKTSKKTNLKK